MNVKEIDAENLTPRELNSQIKEFLGEYDKILIKNPNAKHYLAAGVVDEGEIEFDGSVGYFAGTMCDKAKIKINGKKEICSIELDPVIVDPDDLETLQDILVAGVNEAIKRVEDTGNAEMSKITGNLSIPGLF